MDDHDKIQIKQILWIYGILIGLIALFLYADLGITWKQLF